ncbi:nuclear transport factor 2 family protein [Streptomyces umbrinus]|uniref:nuclear transport factor 2 family protein n=1 Tax=Streptomyces umbrinus TaxID=67370 RepID=UPI003C2EB17F
MDTQWQAHRAAAAYQTATRFDRSRLVDHQGVTVSTGGDIEMKQDLVNRHVRSELAHDWEGALETMTDEPFYEHYPIGIRVRGREAIREMWIRLLNLADLVPEIGKATHKQWFTEDTVVEMYEWEIELADGTTMPSRTWTVFHFRDGLIESERVYSDENATRLIKQALGGEQFMTYPGVERVTIQQ